MLNSSSVISRLPVGNWIDNSFGHGIVDVWTDDFVILNYVVIAATSMILLHSFYINRLKVSSVRVCNDLLAASALAISSFYSRCSIGCSQFENAMMIDLALNAIFVSIFQAADNYITWKRYAVIQGNLSRSSQILTIMYVVVVLYGCWLPFYTLVPFFVNMNNDLERQIYKDFQIYWSFPCYTAYHMYFDLMLVLKILSMRKGNTVSNGMSHLEDLALKAIIHNILSTIGIALRCFYVPLGTPIEAVLCSFAVHFLFNWKAPFKVAQREGRRLSNLASIEVAAAAGSVAAATRRHSLDSLSARVVPIIHSTEGLNETTHSKRLSLDALVRRKSGLYCVEQQQSNGITDNNISST